MQTQCFVEWHWMWREGKYETLHKRIGEWWREDMGVLGMDSKKSFLSKNNLDNSVVIYPHLLVKWQQLPVSNEARSLPSREPRVHTSLHHPLQNLIFCCHVWLIWKHTMLLHILLMLHEAWLDRFEAEWGTFCDFFQYTFAKEHPRPSLTAWKY